MPQATNLKVIREIEGSPVGPGTVFNHVISISAAIRDRAELLNKTERERMEHINRLLQKEHRFKNNIQNKVIERTAKALKEKQAVMKLLEKEYKVDNFITMKTGFDVNTIESKHDARHYIIETRIFNSGFNTKSMKPEVNRQLKKLDPNRKYRVVQKRLLAENRRKNIEMNRAMSDSTFTKMLKDKNNWIQYNYPSGDKLTSSVSHLNVFDVADDKFKQSEETIGEKDEITKKDEQIVEKENERHTREKETVLEKRLPRRQDNAFSMTMRTLGPVYFQSSTYQIPTETGS